MRNLPNPKNVYFWWSACYAYGVRFVRWVIVRNVDGKLDVGTLVESDWLFDKVIINKVPRGCKRGQCILAPHTTLYRTYYGAWNKDGSVEIKKPSVERVRFFEKNK